MPTVEHLSDEQRAIIELVLRRGQTYADVGDKLDLPVSRVRELGREAIVALAPPRFDEIDGHGDIADYLLGQHSGAEARTTQARLSGSARARECALSTREGLAGLYQEGAVPFVPDADPPESDRRTQAGSAVTDGERRSGDARRWRIAAAGAALLALVAFVALGVVLLGDDEPPVASADAQVGSAPGDAPRVIARLDLAPVKGSEGSAAALLVQQGGEALAFIKGQLPPTPRGRVYQVWLQNSDEDAVPVVAEATDDEGHFRGTGPLPADWESYQFVALSLEDEANPAERSGKSVLEAPLWRKRLAHFFGRL